MTDYAVVLTHNRPEVLKRCLAAIAPQVDRVIVVDNASDPRVQIGLDWPANAELIYEPAQPPNLAWLWNQQLNRIENIEKWDPHSVWSVAMLCDDAIVPDGWFDAVVSGMGIHKAAAGCTHAILPVTQFIFKTEPDSDVFNRMTGWAFVLAGEKSLRADETMHWWFCDTDLDWSARAAGGMVIVPGSVVPNEYSGTWTNAKPELTEQAGRDRGAFAAKHGTCPW